MSPQNAPLSPELENLLIGAAEGSLDARQLSYLSALVISDAAARSTFLEYMQLHAMLLWQERPGSEEILSRGAVSLPSAARASDASHRAVVQKVSSAHDSKIKGGFRGASWFKPLERRLTASLMSAAVIVLCGLATMGLWRISTTPAGPAGGKNAVSNRTHIAEISHLRGARKAENGAHFHRGQTLQPGERLRLAEGILEISFLGGARVALEGPAEFEVTQPNEGRLHRGILAAVVPQQAAGFTIHTADARVVDRGTEFGVEYDEESRTHVHVFSGLVDVFFQSASADGGAADSRRVQLKAGEAAASDGDAQRLRQVANAERFRQLRPHTYFDVCDIVAGGDGAPSQRRGGIDAASGRRMMAGPHTGSHPIECAFHAIADAPGIDGAFTIGSEGEPVEISRDGARFSFPATDGLNFGLIWAGGKFHKLNASAMAPSSVAGEIDYGRPPHRALFLHPNKGITFDLRALREGRGGEGIVRFRAVLAHTAAQRSQEALEAQDEELAANDPLRSRRADFWLLIDGRERYVRRGLTYDDGPQTIDVELTADDHLLTIAATDGGDSSNTDWILLGNPQLLLE